MKVEIRVEIQRRWDVLRAIAKREQAKVVIFVSARVIHIIAQVRDKRKERDGIEKKCYMFLYTLCTTIVWDGVGFVTE